MDYRARKPPTGRKAGKYSNVGVIRDMRLKRIDLGRYQQDVADEAGVSQSLVSCWERGLAFPTIDNFEAVLNVLGGKLTIEWLDKPKRT